MSENADFPRLIAPGDASGLIAQRMVQGIDVRLPFDYFGGRVPGSVNLPGSSFKDHIGMVRPDVPVIFICDDGIQSETVAEDAREIGFVAVAVMAGGMDAWLDAGFEIETISEGFMPSAPKPQGA